MTGHVDKTDDSAVTRGKVGISQINGQSALFLFSERVGIDTRESLDQRCFAVIEVTGGCNNH